MSDEVHLFDEGTIIRISITEQGSPLDLTDASVIKIKMERKDRTTLFVDGAVYGAPTNGQVQCISDVTYFTVKGKVTGQVYLEYPSGKWHTSEFEFEVFENIVQATP
jgi:hypothetical protein